MVRMTDGQARISINADAVLDCSIYIPWSSDLGNDSKNEIVNTCSQNELLSQGVWAHPYRQGEELKHPEGVELHIENEKVDVAKASERCLLGIFFCLYSWKIPGQIHNTLGVITQSSLGKPQDSPGGAGENGQGEECLG